MRTGTLARWLSNRGHEVTWWTSAFDHYRKQHLSQSDSTVSWDGGRIRMLRSTGYRRNVSVMRFAEHAGIARKFRREAPHAPRPDIILVSLPTTELAREAVRYGGAHAVPVLVDVRDLWPDALVDLFPETFRPISRLMLRPMLRDARRALSQCDGVVGISNGYLDWALRLARRRPRQDDAMFPLGYVEPTSSREGMEVAGERLRGMGVDASKNLLWYVGSFGRHYDLGPVLEAARCLQQSEGADLQFVISGEGELGARWRALAAGLPNVVFTGWLGGDEINWLRRHAAIGLQPYVPQAPQGLANKLFEYLSAGIPVVSCLRGENEDLIVTNGCGVMYRAGDASDCAAKIRALATAGDRRRLMGERGRQLFLRRFDARVVFDGLATHLEAVVSRYAATGRAFASSSGQRVLVDETVA